MSETGKEAAPTAGGHAAMFVFLTVCIDAMGLGIIVPVLPDLIREITDLGLDGAALWGGWLSFSGSPTFQVGSLRSSFPAMR